jgi:5-methyltetrahydropteroyltriglutamate--homocysteine methyltransferase
VEHPELAADRIVRFAETVSKENVVVSTVCGLGSQVHPRTAWAKLDTLVRAPKWPRANSGARAATVRSG